MVFEFLRAVFEFQHNKWCLNDYVCNSYFSILVLVLFNFPNIGCQLFLRVYWSYGVSLTAPQVKYLRRASKRTYLEKIDVWKRHVRVECKSATSYWYNWNLLVLPSRILKLCKPIKLKVLPENVHSIKTSKENNFLQKIIYPIDTSHHNLLPSIHTSKKYQTRKQVPFQSARCSSDDKT